MNISKLTTTSVLLACTVFFSPLGVGETIPYRDQARVAQGQGVYGAHCASCHGDKLQGQFNWQKRSEAGYLPAPPHDETGHTWHHPDQFLFEWTKYGPQHFAGPEYQSIMPPYEGVLTDTEIWNVLAYIKSKWPQAIQQRHTEAFSR